MKKICIVDFNMAVRGGVEQVTASLSAALADRYEVHVLSLCLTGKCEYQLDPRVKLHELSDTEYRLREMKKRLSKPLCRYINENSIDAVICMGHYAGFIAASARIHTRAKIIFSDHGALINQWHDRTTVMLRLIASVFAHRVITLTEQSRSDYLHKFHLKKRKVQCIYNWINTDMARSERYDAGSKKLVSAGRFGAEKGFDMLIKAFAPVAKKHPDWQLDLFGDGEMMDTVKGLIAEHGIGGNVNLLGMRTDLCERYRDYAMYVLPSYREGMPLVLLEAKFNRLPIVSFDVMTGPREIVRDGVDGVLIPPYDLDKMGEAICRLIEDSELRQSMSDRSQDNLDKFSKPQILQQWCELIESI